MDTDLPSMPPAYEDDFSWLKDYVPCDVCWQPVEKPETRCPACQSCTFC